MDAEGYAAPTKFAKEQAMGGGAGVGAAVRLRSRVWGLLEGEQQMSHARTFGYVLGALAICAASTAPALAQFSGYYRLIARHSGKAVVVSGGSTADNAAVVQFPYSSAAPANDEWSIESIGSGYFRVMARHSGKALVVSGASTASSAPLIQYTYGGSATNDEWAVEDQGTGYHRFVNRNSGKVMDVKQGSTADNAVVQQSTWSGVNQQQYQLVGIGSATPTATPTPVIGVPTPTPTPTPTAPPRATPTPTPTSGSPSGWTLRWQGNASSGLGVFEGLEDDRAGSHTSFGAHIRAESAGYFQWYMHMVDRDGSDRQRHEVKGIRTNGTDLSMNQGSTWMFTYEMYIPSSLTGGDRFTHIYQQKMVTDAGSSGGPLITLSPAGGNTILPRVISGFSSLPLSQYWNKWVYIEFEHKFDFGSNGGYARYLARDTTTGTTLTNQTRTGNMFANEGTCCRRVRPKWGIYRSLESSGLQDTFLRIRNMKAYQK